MHLKTNSKETIMNIFLITSLILYVVQIIAMIGIGLVEYTDIKDNPNSYNEAERKTLRLIKKNILIPYWYIPYTVKQLIRISKEIKDI